MSGYVTANGIPVVSARIDLPLAGIWSGSLVLEDGQELDGPVEIDFASGLTLSGVARRTGVIDTTGSARMVGGAGGFLKPTLAKHYDQGPISVPLNDILDAAGEVLSPMSDQAALSQVQAHWVVQSTTCGRAFAALLESFGLTWRVQTDGQVWVGTESWPPFELEDDPLVRDLIHDRMVLGDVSQGLAPGITIEGRRVSKVRIHVDAQSIRTDVLFQADDVPGQRLEGIRLDADSDPLAGFMRSVFPRLDYFTLWPAKVAGQNANGTLVLIPDDAAIWPVGISNVQMMCGTPGVSAKVLPGARCLFGFGGGLPSRPYALGFEPGALVTEIDMADGMGPVVRVGDAVTGLSNGAGSVTGTIAVATPSKVKA